MCSLCEKTTAFMAGDCWSWLNTSVSWKQGKLTLGLKHLSSQSTNLGILIVAVLVKLSATVSINGLNTPKVSWIVVCGSIATWHRRCADNDREAPSGNHAKDHGPTAAQKQNRENDGMAGVQETANIT